MTNKLFFWMPEQASNFAESLDFGLGVYFVIAALVLAGVTFTLVLFTSKYLRRHPDQLAKAQITHNTKLEILWSVIPLLVFMGLFAWGVKGFIHMRVAPNDALPINVVAQKWSWTFIYPEGASEPELVLPLNKPVKLIMTSRDVIHSFYIPAFRVKQDALPNRYTTLWFTPTKIGTYNLFCAEYCGTQHSGMIRKVKVVEESEYIAWVTEKANSTAGLSPVDLGKSVFGKKGCAACHSVDGAAGIGPTLKGRFEHKVALANGSEVIADAEYIRESIMEPNAKIVKGFAGAMPSYKGQLSDTEMDGLIAYFQTLK